MAQWSGKPHLGEDDRAAACVVACLSLPCPPQPPAATEELLLLLALQQPGSQGVLFLPPPYSSYGSGGIKSTHIPSSPYISARDCLDFHDPF